MNDTFENIGKAVLEGDRDKVSELVKSALDQEIPAIQILEDGLVPGVRALGDLFKDGQVYLPEILISTRAMNVGLALLEPFLAGQEIAKKGCVVLGTVQGDLHDIGKNLVKMMLSSNGFNVLDLGVGVSSQTFVDAVSREKADVVAMSGLLTTTIPYFSEVISALQEAGLKDKVKVIIGGAPVNRETAEEIGAEGFAEDCMSAVDEVMRLMGNR